LKILFIALLNIYIYSYKMYEFDDTPFNISNDNEEIKNNKKIYYLINNIHEDILNINNKLAIIMILLVAILASSLIVVYTN